MQAAFKTLHLITGGREVFSASLEQINDWQDIQMMRLINRVWPEVCTLNERLMLGDPRPSDSIDIPAIDATLASVWAVLGRKDEEVHTRPPHHRWLETLLPALRMLDPGQKPGEKYTYFPPPFHIKEALSMEQDWLGFSLRSLKNQIRNREQQISIRDDPYERYNPEERIYNPYRDEKPYEW